MLHTICLAMLLAGPPPSGPAVGDSLGAAKVKGVFDPVAGKEFSILDRAKKEPTLLVFVQKFGRPAFRLLKELDRQTAKDEKLNTVFVWLSEDVEKTEEYLKIARKSLDFQATIVINLDGKNGPEAYGLNDLVAVTVLVAQNGKVTANFALVDPNDTDAPRILAAVAKALDKKDAK